MSLETVISEEVRAAAADAAEKAAQINKSNDGSNKSVASSSRSSGVHSRLRTNGLPQPATFEVPANFYMNDEDYDESGTNF